MSTQGERTLIEVDEAEVLAEFARVMHEWGCKPFRRGDFRLPTRAEVAGVLSEFGRVRCRGCRRLVAEGNIREFEGAPYGPCCYENARRGELFTCSLCGSSLPAEAMEVADLCTECARVSA